MKILNFKFILTILILMFLTGCISTKSQVFTAGQMDELALINTPNIINIDGENFTMLYKHPSIAEYYLPNEKDFNWSKLVSLSFASNAKVKDYEIGLKNSIPNTTKYLIQYINPDEFIYYLISKPLKDNSNFNSYEASLNYAKNIKCGFFIFSYAKNFNSNAKEATLKKFLKEKTHIFLSSIPDIKCKE